MKKFVLRLVIFLLVFNAVAVGLSLLVFKQPLDEMVKSSPYILGNVLVILAVMNDQFYAKSGKK